MPWQGELAAAFCFGGLVKRAPRRAAGAGGGGVRRLPAADKRKAPGPPGGETPSKARVRVRPAWTSDSSDSDSD